MWWSLLRKLHPRLPFCQSSRYFWQSPKAETKRVLIKWSDGHEKKNKACKFQRRRLPIIHSLECWILWDKFDLTDSLEISDNFTNHSVTSSWKRPTESYWSKISNFEQWGNKTHTKTTHDHSHKGPRWSDKLFEPPNQQQEWPSPVNKPCLAFHKIWKVCSLPSSRAMDASFAVLSR